VHEHGSRRAPLQYVHPVMLVALARSCHAAHEAALRPLLWPVQVARGFVTPHFAALACALQVLRSVQFWQINFAAGKIGSNAGRSVWQKSGLVAAPTDSSRNHHHLLDVFFCLPGGLLIKAEAAEKPAFWALRSRTSPVYRS
jgi:hypothetical protein